MRCKYAHLLPILEKKHPALAVAVKLKLLTHVVEDTDQYVVMKGDTGTLVQRIPMPM